MVVGILPTSLLLKILKSPSDDMNPIAVGILPIRWLLPKYKLPSDDIDHTAKGTVPDNWLLEILIETTLYKNRFQKE